MRLIHLLAAGAATIAVAVPAAAQQPYAYPYAQPFAQPVPQPYPGQPGYGYQQPAYGYAQPGYAQPGYAQPYASNPIEQIVNQLLGNNNSYNVSDRTQVSRCASAALTQAQRQYPASAYGQRGYNQRYGYANANANAQMRVTGITQVQRRSNNGLRVTGLISSGAYAPPYGNAYGYQGQGYGQATNRSFSCNVDYRGQVSSVRLSRSTPAYR